jgi:hypothetical protein
MSDVMTGLRRPGWLTFAAVLMFSVAGVRLISGIAYLADSNKVNDLTGGLFGDNIFWWGLWDLGIAALALAAGYSLLSGNIFGRIIAYAWATLVIIQSFLILSYAPWYGFAAMLFAVLVILALTSTSDYREGAA